MGDAASPSPRDSSPAAPVAPADPGVQGSIGVDLDAAVQALLRDRVGLSDEMLDAVLGAATGRSPHSRGGSLSSSSPASVSVSLRSSLFEDDELSATPRISRYLQGNTPRLNTASDALALEDIETLRYEKRLLESSLRRAEQSAASRLRSTARHYEDQIRVLKTRLAETQKEVEPLKKQLKIARTDFIDFDDLCENLLCSAAHYQTLRNADRSQLTVREVAQMKVFELTASLRAQLAEAAREREKALGKALEAEGRADHAEQRLNAARAGFEARTKELEIELAAVQDDARRSREKASQAINELEEFREDKDRVGSMKSKIVKLENELAEAKEFGRSALAQCEAAREMLDRKASELEHRERDLEIVKQDKTYLARETDARKMEATRLANELVREQDRVQGLQTRLDEAREQLHEARQKARSEYEEKLAREVESMREEHRAQVAQLKETQLNTVERELRAMRTAREEAMAEVEHLRAQLGDAQTALDEARLELATKDATQETALVQARGDLNRRVFEIETLSATVDAKMAAVRKLEIENEMLRDKFEILRDDFAALETSTAKTIVEKTARISTLEEKVHAYEALELELDAAVVDQAKRRVEAQEEESDGLDEDPTEEASEVAIRRGADAIIEEARTRSESSMYAMSKLPIAAQRRVQQSVLLAEKLVRTERELEETKRQCRELVTNLRKAQAQAREAAEVAAGASQPQAFLLDKLRDRDTQLENSRKEISALNAHIGRLQQELQQVEGVRDSLHADLQRVLNDRRALERAIPRVQGRYSPALENLTKSAPQTGEEDIKHHSIGKIGTVRRPRSSSPQQGAPGSQSRRGLTSPQSAPLPGASSTHGGTAHFTHQTREVQSARLEGRPGTGVSRDQRTTEGLRDFNLRVQVDRPRTSGSAFSDEGTTHSHADSVIEEVDLPDRLGQSTSSVASLESSSFVLLQQDEQGIPLPKWYRKLRQNY